MKNDLEQASLLYLGKLLSNDSYYTEELEDCYISLKAVVEERDNLVKKLKGIKEYCQTQINNNENLIERLEGTNSFRIGNAKTLINEFKNILEILGGNK